MTKVALVRCDSYDHEEVKQAVEKGLNLLGGAEKFAKKGERLLFKPNLLVSDPPEKCVTTHPAVFKAAAEVFLATGANITYGDSPGTGYTLRAAKKSGIANVADELNLELADFKTGEEIFYEEGRQNKKFIIAKGVLESDGVISLPKLKTHGLMRYTGCVKNQFGCIPGILKGEFHVKLPNPLHFAKMLVDLNNFIKPRLYIMDGIYGMEGNGPRGGDPKKLNMLLLSEDPIALDATVCRLIKLNPEIVPTIKFGMESGAGTYIDKEIEILGDRFDDLAVHDFNVERSSVKPFKGKGWVGFLNNRFVAKPFIIDNLCVKCGLCVSMCPANPKAVDWLDEDKSKPPVYNYNNCIRCYCCQEICPESAIVLKTPLIRKGFKALKIIP
ncbi:MAG: DUF362 domain-containing protein [Deltaproteobacteria bacterium]|nr:DUF362 domain-containing protein [Deltaproteobacteria bacterium]MBW2053601.1 DUF362 domain-containing protein [Deltaproteobacteria bacterium]MBW2142180.1 DUF362 domain-containing protein [Deltaproteobacteria bacterium]MBW2323378.1 DUF362 domain-containing protein [Deltaproteobacteria bacterium]